MGWMPFFREKSLSTIHFGRCSAAVRVEVEVGCQSLRPCAFPPLAVKVYFSLFLLLKESCQLSQLSQPHFLCCSFGKYDCVMCTTQYHGHYKQRRGELKQASIPSRAVGCLKGDTSDKLELFASEAQHLPFFMWALTRPQDVILRFQHPVFRQLNDGQ